MTITAFPLSWPIGWKRTEPGARTFGRFGTSRTSSSDNWRSKEDITIYAATVRLRQELERMGVRDNDMVLSTNLRTRLDGLPRSDLAQRKAGDPLTEADIRALDQSRRAWDAALGAFFSEQVRPAAAAPAGEGRQRAPLRRAGSDWDAGLSEEK